MNILYFDTETTGLPKSTPFTDPEQPHITQLGFILEIDGNDALVVDTFIKPNGWTISAKASELTGITDEMCEAHGIPIADAVELFIIAIENADMIIAHNSAFDIKLMAMEYARLCPDKQPRAYLGNTPVFCTMKTSTPVCRIPKKDKKTGYKWPKLEELYMFLFNEKLEGAHSAIVDITATRRCFHELRTLGYFDEELLAAGFKLENF